MSANGKFKPGQSGNPRTRFQPGNRHRWQPGQSGNPDGIARRRLEFEKMFLRSSSGAGRCRRGGVSALGRRSRP